MLPSAKTLVRRPPTNTRSLGMSANFNQLLDHASNKENLRINPCNVLFVSNREVQSKEEVQREVYERCLKMIEEARLQAKN